MNRQPLTIEQILTWAKHRMQSTGKWPSSSSGAIPGTICETWSRVDYALRRGTRGLPGGSSLAHLLVEKGGARNPTLLPPLTEVLILQWCDSHFQKEGSWPKKNSGNIVGTKETWSAVDCALYMGCRELPGGSSLARLLE